MCPKTRCTRGHLPKMQSQPGPEFIHPSPVIPEGKQKVTNGTVTVEGGNSATRQRTTYDQVVMTPGGPHRRGRFEYASPG